MANRYWVGGTGSWDGTAGTKWAATSGGAGGASVPTTADDVFFDANSGANTVTIAAGNTGCKSMTCTGFTGTLAGTAALTIAGGFTFVAGMTLTYSGAITITDTGTLTSGGKTINSLTINGSGITATLGDNLSVTGVITVTQGTFTTSASNYNVIAGLLSSNNSNTRTITLGSSTVTLNGSGTVVDFTTNTNLTFNAGTSSIICSTTGTLNFYGGGSGAGVTFYNVSFTGASTQFHVIQANNTFNNLTITGPSTAGIRILQFNAAQTINGTFSTTGTAANRRIWFRSQTIGTSRTFTCAAVSLTDADFRDITIAGAAAPASGTRLGDCKGNSGITFDAAKTVYWNLAGAQNWSATGWATTQTGTPAANNFPLAQDTATFTDAGSVTGTITLDTNWNIGTIDMSGRTSAMTLATGSTTPTIYGNWTNGSGTTLSGTGQITFLGRNTQTITSAGKQFSQPVVCQASSGFSGTLLLGDEFNSANFLTCTNTSFNTQNNNLTALEFGITGTLTRTVTLGSSTVTVTGTGPLISFSATNLTFNANTSNIVLSNTSTTARTFAGGGLTFNKLTIGGTTGISTTSINGANTFSELASTKTVAHTISFGANQTITTWSVTGTAGNLVTINSDTANTSRTLTITNRTTGIDYLDVRDITSNLTPVTFYAGANTRLRSNVQGVAARAPVSTEFIYVLTSGTSFTVPANWNNNNNEIHLFAGGGGGSSGRAGASSTVGGAGGGGGGYTKATNVALTPSGSVSYAIGAAGTAGSNGVSGGNTTFNSGTYTTTGGGGGQAVTTPPSSTGGTAGTGSTFNGGVGGSGATAANNTTYSGGGGGAGAGGPLGAGQNGGNGFNTATQANVSGGGGGGNGGGTAGGNASSATGGTGGNNNAGTGGGSASAGFNGGGGAGGVSTAAGFQGGSGSDIVNAGMGGGGGAGGAGDAVNTTAIGGLFGGGGAGGSSGVGSTKAGSSGGQGGIVIWYSTVSPSNGNFFFLFN